MYIARALCCCFAATVSWHDVCYLRLVGCLHYLSNRAPCARHMWLCMLGLAWRYNAVLCYRYANRLTAPIDSFLLVHRWRGWHAQRVTWKYWTKDNREMNSCITVFTYNHVSHAQHWMLRVTRWSHWLRPANNEMTKKKKCTRKSPYNGSGTTQKIIIKIITHHNQIENILSRIPRRRRTTSGWAGNDVAGE